MPSFARKFKNSIALLSLLSLVLLAAFALPAAADGSGVFASIRIFDGVDPADMAEIARLSEEGFLPMLQESDGFLAYYAILTEANEVVALNFFLTPEEAAASNAQALDFVAEHMAPLLPNPPRIVEGAVDIGAINFMERDMSELYASVRVYDGFDMANQEPLVETTRAGFLPMMAETEGFAAYYLMTDGADTLAAISIFDSEAEALASNDAAREFVGENLAEYLPESPAISSGRAAIAELNVERWAAEALDLPAHASIRHYEGVDPQNMDEIVRRTEENFLPRLRESAGFIAYYLLPGEDTLTAVNLFTTGVAASLSNTAAAHFVAERLAPLLPNAPQIFEGMIDIDFVEALEDMSGLHASVRLYDGFAQDDIADFVAIVEDGFLPIMRETDGFFGYYLMHNDDAMVAAISIFDSEASALASNDQAADFVAENLTAYLPNNPTISSGQLGIAAVAEIRDGANLIDDPVFISIRVYDGVDPGDQDEIVARVDEGFLPILRGSDGFIAYYLLPAGDMLAAINIFETAEQSAASNDKAADFVAENLAPLLPNPPDIVEGLIDVSYQADTAGDRGALYAALRVFENYDMTNLADANVLVEKILLPAQQELGGMFSYHSMSDGVDRVAGLSVFDTEANALAANEVAAAFVAEHLADALPEDPLRLSGELGVVALAAVEMGANLAG